jgi:four helix bundle protein
MRVEQNTKGTKRTEGTSSGNDDMKVSSLSSPESLKSLDSKDTPEGFIPAHGGYQNLRSFQKAQIVYDATVYFCARFLSKRDRTCDQMVQAARSGKQNIVEGSQISGTSKELEIKLANVARASLEELLTDYRDFLRTRNLRL